MKNNTKLNKNSTCKTLNFPIKIRNSTKKYTYQWRRRRRSIRRWSEKNCEVHWPENMNRGDRRETGSVRKELGIAGGDLGILKVNFCDFVLFLK